jgi:large subunit ribosomal protein L6
MSRVGSNPIPVPSGVDVTIDGRHVTVKGSKGELRRELPGPVTVSHEGDELVVARTDDERESRSLHRLAR